MNKRLKIFSFPKRLNAPGREEDCGSFALITRDFCSENKENFSKENFELKFIWFALFYLILNDIFSIEN